MKSLTKVLYYDASVTFRILVKIIQGYWAGAPEQKELELSLKLRSGAIGTAIWEVALAP